MIGLDTNVLVRYIMQDDPKQAMKATHLVASLTPAEPGFVTVVTVVELFWVRFYSLAMSMPNKTCGKSLSRTPTYGKLALPILNKNDYHSLIFTISFNQIPCKNYSHSC